MTAFLEVPAPFTLRRIAESPRFFLVLVLAAIAGLLCLASIGQIDRVVRVEGKIIPAGRSQDIQHLEGGIVASIHVAEGDVVKKGAILLTIDNTSAEASLGENKGKLLSLKLRAARLEAETHDQESLTLPPDLASSRFAEGERQLFQSRRTKLAQEIMIYQDSMAQRQAELDDNLKHAARLTSELATARQRSAMMVDMAANNAASRLEVLEAQSRAQRLETEIAEAKGAQPRLEGAIAEQRARIAAAKATFRSEAQNERVTTLAEIARLEQTLTTDSDRVRRTEIRAPVDGIINRIAVNTVGGVVKPGQSIIELTPTTSGVLVEARAKPQDRGYLHQGLESSLRISAYDVSEYGVLKGRVTDVSADSLQDSRGDPYYRVTLLVEDVPARYRGKTMIPGMTVTGDIVTGHRTLLKHLLSPLSKFTYNMFRDSR